MAISRAAATLVAVLLLASLATPAAAQGPHAAVSCQGDAMPKAVTDARVALGSDPNSLEAQLKLADALIDHGCYREAVPVLEAGLSQRPRSPELDSRLRAARSMLSEASFFEGLGTAQESAKLQHDQLRCTRLSDISACDDALRARPGDPQMTTAKADALLHSGRAADAMILYRHALELKPGDDGIKAKLADAESHRQALVVQCEGNGDAAAVDACQAALIHGGPDEFALLKRKGILLQSVDKPEQALDALIAAAVIKQDDQAVALAIVALTASTGRKDALALSARGSALLTLGRATEALPALHQAQSLAPALPGIKGQLARADKVANEEARRQTRSASAKPANTAAATAATAMAAQPAGATKAKSNPATPPVVTSAYSNDATPGQSN